MPGHAVTTPAGRDGAARALSSGGRSFHLRRSRLLAGPFSLAAQWPTGAAPSGIIPTCHGPTSPVLRATLGPERGRRPGMEFTGGTRQCRRKWGGKKRGPVVGGSGGGCVRGRRDWRPGDEV